MKKIKKYLNDYYDSGAWIPGLPGIALLIAMLLATIFS